jgi:hypothetical protein
MVEKFGWTIRSDRICPGLPTSGRRHPGNVSKDKPRVVQLIEGIGRAGNAAHPTDLRAWHRTCLHALAGKASWVHEHVTGGLPGSVSGGLGPILRRPQVGLSCGDCTTPFWRILEDRVAATANCLTTFLRIKLDEGGKGG